MTVEQRKDSKLLWGIIGGLILIIAAVFAYLNFSSKDEVQDIPATSEAISSEANVVAESSATTVASETVNTETSTLITEDVLKASIPEDSALAKEEVAKLNDIQNQLKDQQKLLKEQHADADQIIDLKEEQIKILEAQLAESK
jgi:hypothetical protein